MANSHARGRLTSPDSVSLSPFLSSAFFCLGLSPTPQWSGPRSSHFHSPWKDTPSSPVCLPTKFKKKRNHGIWFRLIGPVWFENSLLETGPMPQETKGLRVEGIAKWKQGCRARTESRWPTSHRNHLLQRSYVQTWRRNSSLRVLSKTPHLLLIREDWSHPEAIRCCHWNQSS